MPVPVIRLIRFCARNGLLTPKYARLALRYARRRLLTVAGWRWETNGLLFLGKRLEIQIARRGRVRFGRFVWVGDGTKIRCHEGEVRSATRRCWARNARSPPTSTCGSGSSA